MTVTLDEFEQNIHHAIPVYIDKKEIEINEIETLKEENNKLKQDMSEKEILIEILMGNLKELRAKQMWQIETRKTRKHQSRQNVTLQARNRIAPLQNTQVEVFR